MITTSRYCSKETITLAKNLAKENNEKYISRAKKSIEKLVYLSRILGEDKILIVEEESKKPQKILTIKLDAFGKWNWDSNEIKI